MKIHESISKHQEKTAKQALYRAIAAIESPQEVKQFLEDLCSPAEIQAMADRWAVVKPIKDGMSYRKIAENTGVSVTTIGRVARCINFGSGGYNLIYERLENNKQL